MNNIFERTPGFNNEEMWKQCELLKSVVFQTIETKVGRGKSVRVIETFKHNTPLEVRERLANSCEHYKKLYQMEEVIDIVNAVGSTEPVEFRDYQIDIIRQGTVIVKDFGFVYLAMEVRTGKTLTSLGIASKLDVDKVLFLTKKKGLKFFTF